MSRRERRIIKRTQRRVAAAAILRAVLTVAFIAAALALSLSTGRHEVAWYVPLLVVGATWTDFLDRAVGFLWDASTWNTFFGATGSVMAMKGDFGWKNLILNSDFSRRTVLGLAMPEVFADLSAWTAVTGSLGTVAANVWTPGGTGAWIAKHSGFAWSDGRFSAEHKATDDANGGSTYNGVGKLVDANNYVMCGIGGGLTDQFQLYKRIAGVSTQVTFANFAPTLNRFYWTELDAQGATYTAKLYENTVQGAKSAATLVATISGTVADAAVATGVIALFQDSNATTAKAFGGQSASPGGVYLETWLPESWTVSFGGTLGGQAFGLDEAADSGPLTKQWTPVAYIPATSRTVSVQYAGPDGGLNASTAYTASFYEKGTASLIRVTLREQTSASGTVTDQTLGDYGDASFARKSATFTTNAATRRFTWFFSINPGSSLTGTIRFDLPQVEQGSAATAWRNAPADDAPIVWQVTTPGDDLNRSTASVAGAFVEMDPRDLAVNIFLPCDANVVITQQVAWTNSGANYNLYAPYVDGALPSGAQATYGTAMGNFLATDVFRTATFTYRVSLAAGKHRIASRWAVTAGTATMRTLVPNPLIITATRGK